jgi:hypothetical protein
MYVSFVRLVAVVSVLSLAAVGQAQGIRDAGSKIRGDYGSVSPARTYYSAPRMMTQAPVAPVPTEQRSFSAQPGQAPAQHDGCMDAAAKQGGQSVAQAPNRSGERRFSYEPAQPTYRRPVRSYQSPTSGIRDAGSKIRGF